MIYDQVMSWVRKDPERACVLEGGRVYTCGRMLRDIEAFRTELARARVGPGDLVAVACVGRGQAIAGMLAAWSVGAAYLPLAHGLPKARVRTILDTARPAVVLTDDDGDGPGSGICHLLDDPAKIDPSTAYVIFTSGSTGKPKGVVVSHAGLGPMTRWYKEITTLEPGDVAGQVAQLSFDASVLEIWGALANGAALAVPSLDAVLDPVDYQDFLRVHEVRASFVPTGMVAGVLDQDWPAGFPTRMLFTGGDRLTRRPEPRHPFAFYNIYGPAECTVAATCQQIGPGDGPPPIGRALPYVRVRVSGDGELWLGGPALALGYLGAGDEAFVRHDGERWYRTGDLVSADADGVLHYLSRADDQIQIGGRRTEPAEIVHAILMLAGLTDAVVYTRETASGEVRLAAAVTPATANKQDIQRHLQDLLPAYMIPSEIAAMDALPLTRHGKIDVDALRGSP
ncbi:AMP-binding protein [Nonomuraea endophytica]|uniref:Non-ribosomal peptide synthetase component F n=1 Tax=Nonomuraea endophytica TaxID=714136 RepID=A0A7W8EGR3_9ACTN|nr:AMP-binding protein [Nonomuraea endophytica]MBB5080140.1 non-ribosomal peptide synthetase component F [Nonomuraea endophytica]